MGYNAWDIIFNNRVIDTVFYNDDCDKDYVLRGLIEHDGYNPNIKIRKAYRIKSSIDKAKDGE